MAECRDLEEVVYGPDGDQERNICSALTDAFQAARADGIDRLRIECRTQPNGVGRSTTDWNRLTNVEDPPEAVRDAIYNALRDSPGEGFCGKIRLSFLNAADASHRVGSYSRTMRTGFVLSPEDADPTIQNGTGSLRAHFDDAVRPALEMALRFADKNISMANIMAQTWATSAGSVPVMDAQVVDNGADKTLLASMLQGALQIASAANDTDRAAAAANTLVQTATYTPPPPRQLPGPAPHQPHYRPAPSPFNPPPMLEERRSLLTERSRRTPNPHRTQPPFDPARLTTEDVTKWAAANPSDAEALVRAAVLNGGKF